MSVITSYVASDPIFQAPSRLAVRCSVSCGLRLKKVPKVFEKIDFERDIARLFIEDPKHLFAPFCPGLAVLFEELLPSF